MTDMDNRSGEGRPRELKQARSELMRERLIDAAVRILCDDGYAALTTPKVAKVAGVSRGALQYHFPSRVDLILAVRTRMGVMVSANVSVADLIHMPLEGKVSCLVDAYWSFIGSADYVAALEIRLNERLESGHSQPLSRHLTELTERRDRDWLRVFAGSPLSSGEIIGLRRFMLDSLRGFALRQMEGADTSQSDLLIRVVKLALVEALKKNNLD